MALIARNVDTGSVVAHLVAVDPPPHKGSSPHDTVDRHIGQCTAGTLQDRGETAAVFCDVDLNGSARLRDGSDASLDELERVTIS